MAKDVRLSLPGLNAIMTAPAVQATIDRIGRQMAGAAGDGFEYVSRPHPRTARGYVQTINARGRRRQAREAALERALGQVQR